MNALRRAFADVSVGQVHYVRCGVPGAPVVLLLHQSPRSWREYEFVLPLLGARWDVIAMDTAGFGDSAELKAAPSIEGYAGVALELLRVLEVPSVHVVGHHTGGMVALEMAALAPDCVRSLVLSATSFVDAAFRQARATRPPIDAVEVDPDGRHLTTLWQRRQAFYPPDRPDLLGRFVRDALAVSDPEAGHRAAAAYVMESRVGRVSQPVCLLRAPQDPFTESAWQAFVRHWPRARVVTLDGGGVPAPEQMPEAFARAVDEFLRTLA